MARRPGRDLPLEWLDTDPAPISPPGIEKRPRRPKWTLALGAAGAAVAVAGALLSRSAKSTNATPAGAPPAVGTTLAPAAPLTRPVQVTTIGRPLLAAPAGWELVGSGPAELVRLQLGEGRIIRTQMPSLQSSGPQYLVAGRDGVIVRPLDFVPGYLVPDGQPPVPMSPLPQGGPAYPGPDEDHLWVEIDAGQGSGQREMALVAFDGTPTGQVVPSPDTFPLAGDGTGFLLFARPDGVYLGRPDGMVQVTTGALVATGPTRFLTEQCDPTPVCHLVVTDRATGAVRPLGPYPLLGGGVGGGGGGGAPPGVVSPDGTTAAVTEYATAGPVLHLIDLRSGRDRAIGGRVADLYGNPDVMVWTPDSRTLFYVDPLGTLRLVDAATGQTHTIGVPLPPLFHLIFRVRA
ncbi:MAG TPA: hypothetical protein VHT75_12445 [Acidimicrobiales bacterium]|nr:hypothetical protein [Acidimicrobiales bacterium]